MSRLKSPVQGGEGSGEYSPPEWPWPIENNIEPPLPSHQGYSTGRLITHNEYVPIDIYLYVYFYDPFTGESYAKWKYSRTINVRGNCISYDGYYYPGRYNIIKDRNGSNKNGNAPGYEAINNYAQFSHFYVAMVEGAAKLTIKESAQAAKMIRTEAEVTKLIGNIARVAKITGYAGEAVVIGANIYNVYTNPTPENWARAGISGLAVGVNALNFVVPGLGLGLSLGITAIDLAGGFNWFYDLFK